MKELLENNNYNQFMRAYAVNEIKKNNEEEKVFELFRTELEGQKKYKYQSKLKSDFDLVK